MSVCTYVLDSQCEGECVSVCMCMHVIGVV